MKVPLLTPQLVLTQYILPRFGNSTDPERSKLTAKDHGTSLIKVSDIATPPDLIEAFMLFASHNEQILPEGASFGILTEDKQSVAFGVVRVCPAVHSTLSRALFDGNDCPVQARLPILSGFPSEAIGEKFLLRVGLAAPAIRVEQTKTGDWVSQEMDQLVSWMTTMLSSSSSSQQDIASAKTRFSLLTACYQL